MRSLAWACGLFLTLSTFIPLRAQSTSPATAAASPVLETARDPKTWRELRRGNMQIIFQEADRGTAQEVALAAEKVYPLVKQWFLQEPERIPIYLNRDAGLLNGSATNTAIIINPVAPSGEKPLFRYQRWLELLVLHELVHYFHLNYRPSLGSTLSDVMGNQMMLILLMMPPWMTEGTATLQENLLLPGLGRGSNPHFELYMRSIVLDNLVPNYYQVNLDPLFKDLPTGRRYLLGYYLLDYLQRHYYPSLPRQLANILIDGGDIAKSLQMLTGRTAQQLYQDMISELQGLYRQQGGDLPSRPSLFSPQNNSSLPLFTASGMIYASSLPDQPTQLWWAKPPQATSKAETLPFRSYQLKLSADQTGNTLVAVGLFYQQSQQQAPDLVVRQQGQWRRLTYAGRLHSPALSPDGKTLLALQNWQLSSRLVEVSLQDGTLRPLLQPNDAAVVQPSWSPNTQKLLFKLHYYKEDRVELWQAEWPDMANARLLASGGTDSFYSPFYDQQDNIWFVTRQNKGPLALYRYRPQTDPNTIELALSDRIGVSAATIDPEGNIYYQSFENFRQVIKRVPAGELLWQKQAFQPDPPNPPSRSNQADQLNLLSPPDPLDTADAQSLLGSSRAELPGWSEHAGQDSVSMFWLPHVELDNIALGAWVQLSTMFGWELDGKLSYSPTLHQPQGNLSVSFGPPTFHQAAQPWRISYTAARNSDSVSFSNTQQLSATFLSRQSLGYGTFDFELQPALTLKWIDLHSKVLPFWQQLAPLEKRTTTLTPNIELRTAWERKWPGDWGGEGLGLNMYNGLEFRWTHPQKPSNTSYLLSLSAYGDIPLLRSSTLRIQAEFSLDSHGQSAEALLSPPTGWIRSVYIANKNLSVQHQVRLRLPFFFTEDTPLGDTSLNSFHLSTDFTGRYSFQSGSTAVRYQYYAGVTLGLLVQIGSHDHFPLEFSFGTLLFSSDPASQPRSFGLSSHHFGFDVQFMLPRSREL